MQVNQGFNGLRVMNDQPFLGPPNTRKQSTARPSTTGEGDLPPVVQGPPSLVEASFGSFLRRVGGPLPPTPKPIDPGPTPLGEPPHVDQLEIRVRDYREMLSGVHANLVSQLKSAQDTLKQARQSGDADAISAAQQAT